jgi:purine-binding chemotaxis protein CheW
MSNATTTAPSNHAAGLAGKYLTFVLGKESYGIPVKKVREIIRIGDITVVPQMPHYVKGVYNLRGKIIPIFDLRLKFGFPSAENTERTCIVVVQVESAAGVKSQAGLVVDAVEEVSLIPAEDIEPTPDFGGRIDTACILGMAKVRGQVKALLDIGLVVSLEVSQQVMIDSAAA